jgi:hypothetical protein
MLGLAQSNLSYDFEALNAAGAVWNGAAFVTYAVADYASYRIAATKQGDASNEDIKAWFYAADVSGAVRWQMRERGASLALSPIVWVGPDVTETALAASIAAAAAVTADLDGLSLAQALRAIKAKTDLIGTIRSLIRW